ncbi:MAG: tetratricopeptide repeat protein, partial [Candidatus Krumholzibacteria bacterium]|nr:tetratricopeptide repeat protein [Candidatus Krumholzibacteria bacterium]
SEAGVGSLATVGDAAASDFEDQLRKDLMAAVRERDVEAPAVSPKDRTRAVALSGPPTSGKSYVVETLRSDIRPRGFGFVLLSDTVQFEELFAESPGATHSRAADPSAMVIEHRVAAWEQLLVRAEKGGLVIAVDDYQRLGKNAREFLEYIVKRVGFLVSEGQEPKIFFFVTDDSPRLKKDLAQVVTPHTPIHAIGIPPPRNEDVDSIVSAFHGRMPLAEQRRSLAGYLQSNLESDGTVMMALREAVAEEDLEYESGQWHFRAPQEPAVGRRPTSHDYYERVFGELWEDAQVLVRWLACHRGSLSMGQLQDLSGLDAEAIEQALENLRPYRVLDVGADKDERHVKFASDDVREAFYQVVEPSDRDIVHAYYIEYLLGYKDESLRGLETLVFHYERAGRARDALLTRIRALAKAKREKDIYGVRRLCDDGIAFIRGIATWDAKSSSGHVERFFIKNLIEVDWSVNSYRGVIEVVDTQLKQMNRPVPLSFVYTYASSLESSGDYEGCLRVVEESKRRIANESSETYHHVLLAKACALHEMHKFKEALEVLKSIRSEALSPSVLARYYVYCMLVYQALGDYEERARYLERARKAATKVGSYLQLLRVNYNIAMFLLSHTKYSEAKRLIRESIRLASRHRVYRSLCTMYYVASVVYAEGGDYVQALKYAEKAIRLGMDIGMDRHVNSYIASTSVIYRNLGRYGTALNHLESVKSRAHRGDRHYFYALVMLFGMCVTVHSRLAHTYAEELKELARQEQYTQPMALYHQFLGNYKQNASKHEDAIAEYSVAVELYNSIHHEDDSARSRIAMAHSHLALRQVDQVLRIIEDLRGPVAELESNEIRADYENLRLAYEIHADSNSQLKIHAINRCEQLRAHPMDIKVRMQMDATLFRASVSLERNSSAITHFNQYYSQVKDVCSNLPSADMVNDYIENREFVDLVRTFRELNRKSPRQ